MHHLNHTERRLLLLLRAMSPVEKQFFLRAATAFFSRDFYTLATTGPILRDIIPSNTNQQKGE